MEVYAIFLIIAYFFIGLFEMEESKYPFNLYKSINIDTDICTSYLYLVVTTSYVFMHLDYSHIWGIPKDKLYIPFILIILIIYILYVLYKKKQRKNIKN